MHVLHEEVNRELREEIRAGDEETQRLMRVLHEEVNREFRAGDEETQRLMRVLHEDVIGRFALLTEGRGPGGRRKRRREDAE